jgi:hypothetical protein
MMARTAKQQITVRKVFRSNPKKKKAKRRVVRRAKAKRVRTEGATVARLAAMLRKMTGTKKNPARRKAKKKTASGRYIIKAKLRTGKVPHYYTGNSFVPDKAAAEVIHGRDKTASKIQRMRNRLPYAIASVSGVAL